MGNMQKVCRMAFAVYKLDNLTKILLIAHITRNLCVTYMNYASLRTQQPPYFMSSLMNNCLERANSIALIDQTKA